MNYRICLRHMRENDNVFIFWAPNNTGYVKCLEAAGLYPDSENNSKDDFLVPVGLIDKLKQKVVLSQYGDSENTYCGLKEFMVLPNTGQVRLALGISVLDFKLSGSNNSFSACFKNTVIEKLKYNYIDNLYRVKAKESVDEFWYYDETFEAETPSQAISKAYKKWDFNYHMSYIEFKGIVNCCKEKGLILDKWVTVNEL